MYKLNKSSKVDRYLRIEIPKIPKENQLPHK